MGVGVTEGDASVALFFLVGFAPGEAVGASTADVPFAVSACEIASAFLRVGRFVGVGDCMGVPVKTCDSTRPTQIARPIARITGSSLPLTSVTRLIPQATLRLPGVPGIREH
jgi:hypothetical protein